MKIRIATDEDIEKITKNNLLIALESEKKKIDYGTVYEAVKNLIKDKSKGFYLVYQKNSKIIGQLMITYEWSDWNNNFIWWIQSAYVDKSYRKQGIFNKLINHIKIIAKDNEVNKLKLYVYQNNDKAITAYKKIGFKKQFYEIYQIDL
jgi:ribosomal protein S18 acetylase RimI-like enzyme